MQVTVKSAGIYCQRKPCHSPDRNNWNIYYISSFSNIQYPSAIPRISFLRATASTLSCIFLQLGMHPAGKHIENYWRKSNIMQRWLLGGSILWSIRHVYFQLVLSGPDRESNSRCPALNGNDHSTPSFRPNVKIIPKSSTQIIFYIHIHTVLFVSQIGILTLNKICLQYKNTHVPIFNFSWGFT